MFLCLIHQPQVKLYQLYPKSSEGKKEKITFKEFISIPLNDSLLPLHLKQNLIMEKKIIHAILYNYTITMGMIVYIFLNNVLKCVI